MKKFNLFVALFLLFVGNYSNSQESNEIDTVATIEEVDTAKPIVLDGFRFEFNNDREALTLKVLKTGRLKFNWNAYDGNDPFLGVKYSVRGKNEWKVVSFESSLLELEIPNLYENQFFDYYLGSGDSEYNLTFEDTPRVFNTLCSSVFKSNQGKDKEEAIKITWGIEHDLLTEILQVYPNAYYKIEYNTDIGSKQNKTDSTKSPWKVEDQISINDVSETLKDLRGGEKYVYKIGLVLDETQTIYSEKNKVTTERSWGIFRLLVLIGALGMFIFGMKVMSEGLQQSAGSRLRKMLGSITSNRFKGVVTGFGITSVVQSSSVTTVMTVSFVNAGLMTLRQSAGVMMGANIGTTITAWLILFFGFKVSLNDYAFVFIAFGAPLLFFSKSKLKSWANVIIGFSLLFMGLGALKDAVPDLGPESPLVQFFIDFKGVWYGPIMFVFLGALVTIIIQSSSAAMALTMTMVAGGVIPFEVASAMILGENIGTTITAELASIIGNVHAKRSARIHSLFNIIGVGWAILFFPFILKALAFFIEGDPYTDGDAATFGLALFHTSFNLLNVLLLIGFVPWLVRMAEKTVKSKGAADEEFKLDYIGTGIMNTPDLSLLEAQKEIAKFGEITSRMSGFTQTILTERNAKQKNKLHSKIKKYEEITDRVEIEVANYLAKISEGEMSEESAQRVRAMNSIVNDLERIGDIFYQMSKTIERKDEQKIYFLPEQRQSLLELFKLVDEAFAIMIDNLNSDWNGVLLQGAIDAEDAINRKRDRMRTEHLQNVGKKNFNMDGGMMFGDLFSLCEKIGDHIINVSEAVVGEI